MAMGLRPHEPIEVDEPIRILDFDESSSESGDNGDDFDPDSHGHDDNGDDFHSDSSGPGYNSDAGSGGQDKDEDSDRRVVRSDTTASSRLRPAETDAMDVYTVNKMALGAGVGRLPAAALFINVSKLLIPF